MAGFVVALCIALSFYGPLAYQLLAWLPLPYGVAKPVAFLLLWALSDLLYGATIRSVLAKQLWGARRYAVGRLLGIHSSRDRTQDHMQLYSDTHPALMTLIHDIDLALWISGARALRASAYERGGDGAPALVWGHVEADDGSLWSLGTSWLLAGHAAVADRLEVYGSDGAVTLDPQLLAGLRGPAWGLGARAVPVAEANA